MPCQSLISTRQDNWSMRRPTSFAIAAVAIAASSRSCAGDRYHQQQHRFGGPNPSRRLDSTANKTVEVDSSYTSSTAATKLKSTIPVLSSELSSLAASFAYDGSTSDLSRQFLKMYADGYAVDKINITHADLPDSITTRLDQRSLNFDKLDGLLQRTVVWDSGYAIGSDGALVEILVEGDRTMAEIAVTSPEFFSTAGCMALICDVDGSDFYRHLYCSGEQINSVAHCGIDMPSQVVTSSMWATGGESTDIPEILVLGHTWTDSSSATTYDVVSIHTIKDANDPVYGECVDGIYHSAMTIPCVPLDSANAHTDRVDLVDWNKPTASDLVESWLDYTAESSSSTSTASDASSSSNSSPTDPSTTINDSSASSSNGSGDDSPSIGLYIGIAAGVLVVLAVGILIFILCRRRRANADSRDPPRLPETAAQRAAPLQFSSPRGDYMTASHFGNGKNRGSTAATRSTDRSSMSSEAQTMDIGPLLLELNRDPNVSGLRVPYDSIAFLQVITRGAFGEVSKCVCKGVVCASKRLVRSRQSRHDVELFVDEIRLTASLSHRNVIQVVGVAWNTPFDLCMIMEYFSGGDVMSFIQHHGAGISWKKEKLFIAYGLAEAIAYIHNRPTPVIHRDIKARNVLLNEMLDAKLIDFGISRNCIDETMTAGVGTPYWTAPEVLMGERYTLQSDIYSFGIVLAELDREDLPYRASQLSGDIGMMQVLTKIIQKGLRPEFAPTCPVLIKELALSCMSIDPLKRPSSKELPSILRGLHQGI
jgi:mitogen-activated protein kinase kinase kinase 7